MVGLASFCASVTSAGLVFVVIRNSYTNPMPRRSLSPDIEALKPAKPASYKQKPFGIPTLLNFVETRFAYVWKTKSVFHTLTHSFTILLLYSIISNPLTVLIMRYNSEANTAFKAIETGTIAELPTRNNFCSGLVLDLVWQGAVLNVIFVVGSAIYAVTLTKCPPRLYYAYCQPMLFLVTGLCVFVASSFRSSAIFFLMLLSTSQVIPYYLNSFNYFVLSTATHADFYGFTTTCYALGTLSFLI